MTDLSGRLTGLSDKKRALLAQRLRGEPKAAAAGAIPRRPGQGPVRLSFAQERLWFVDRWRPGTAAYNLLDAIQLVGRLDSGALVAALSELVRRHEALRTVFLEREGVPYQVVNPAGAEPLPVIDLTALPSDRRRPLAQALAQAEGRVPFDLAGDPLLRARLVRLGAEEHFLVLVLHHIATDLWSFGILIRELGTVYNRLSAGDLTPLPELPIQYADFAAWQRGWLTGEVLEGQLGYWRKQLQGAPVALDLPTDRPRPAAQGFAGAVLPFTLAADLLGALRALAQQSGGTLFMVAWSAFAALLSRYSGQRDLLLGFPIAGRTRREVEPLIGLFINTLVLRADLTGDPSFREIVDRAREATLGAFAHQELPFEKLVEELQPERDLARAPLVQVLVTLQNAPVQPIELHGLTFTPHLFDTGTAKLDLSLFLTEEEGVLQGGLEYSTELFDRTTMERLIRQWRTVLRTVVEQPATRWSELPLLAADERQQLLIEWNDNAAPAAAPVCLHELFSEQAARTPGAVALIWGEQRLTYRDLDVRSGALAGRLRALGVEPEVVVAVSAERTPALVVGLLGILRAGGAYVPLDPAYPRERREMILADSGAALLLASRRYVGEVTEWASGLAAILDLDELAEGGPAPALPASPAPAAGPDNLAYLIYTSGSTGRPKGVAIEHRSAVALAHWARRVFSAEDWQGVLFSTSINFDLSVFELFVPLAWGGRVILADNALALPALPAAGEVTLVNTVPSALAELVREGRLPASVRTVNLAGEPLPRELADRIYALEGVERLFNLYGPSEDTTYSTGVLVPRSGGKPSIGRPVDGTWGYVLDDSRRPAPLGGFGELYLGGAGLARGYWRRPDLTAERFVPDPFDAGGRLYRTGDLVRYRPDGEIDFLGRIDHQIKIRGFRIELGEVEAALGQIPGIRGAAAGVRETRGDRQLVAYLAADNAQLPAPAELREQLRARLPEAMIPTAFVVLEALPLNPNGKIDRKALARLEPEAAGPADTDDGQRTPVQELVADIWSQVLGVERVGLRESFFDIGGHSLLATRVLSRVREAFGAELSLPALFEAPTVAGLAARIEELTLSGNKKALPPLLPVPRTGSLPLSFAQERLWFLDRLEPGSNVYNIPGALRIEGPLEVAVWTAVHREIVRRHEALRTTFRAGAAGGEQVIAGPESAPPVLPVVDLTGLPEGGRDRIAGLLAEEEAERPFDLEQGPLLRVTAVRIAPEEAVLLFNMHHIVSDGWSMGVFFRELATLYEAYAGNRRPDLPDLPVQYADYAVWQRSCLQGEALAGHVEYWRSRLAGAPPVLELPWDRPRSAGGRRRSIARDLLLDDGVVHGVRALGRREQTTLFMTLLTSFAVLLHRLSGQEDLCVGTPVAGRDHLAIEGLIGFFVNTLVIRSEAAGEPSFRELLGRVRSATLGAYGHQELPFEKLVEELQPERSLAHSPLFQVMFLLQNVALGDERAKAGANGASAADQSVVADTAGAQIDLVTASRLVGQFELPGLRLSLLPLGAGEAPFDLVLTLLEDPRGLIGSLAYDAQLCDATTAERLIRQWRTVLAAAVEQPEARWTDLSLLAAGERQQLLVEWNDTPPAPAAPTAPACLHELFEAQAARTPGAVALIWGEERLTYGDLAGRSGTLAGRLRALGVGPEVVVAISAERTPALVVGLLGILRAGGAYVPLDPAYPRERRETILTDSGAALVLASRRFVPEIAEWASGNAAILDLDELAEGGSAAAAPASEVGPANLAYLIYTSGSTGRPKGVAIEHGSAVALARWAQRVFPAADWQGVLFATSINFDLSVFELFVPLAWGGRVILADNALALPRLPAAGEVTLVNTVPSAMAELVREGQLPASVRTVNLAGEPLPRELADRIHGIEGVERLFNLYGPSEDTTYSTAVLVPRAGGKPSVGRPVDGTHGYVLDGRRQLAALGAFGELYLGGAGLARGYWQRPDLTAERFVPDPFGGGARQSDWNGGPGARLYRTGDLVRLRPDGEIDFLGRVDRQVKVRGFRIELGEIETALASHPGVREAAVLVEDGNAGPRLAAFLAPEPGTALAPEDLRQHLAGKLPGYMVPGVFCLLEALPLTPNGKVDRRALARLDLAAATPGHAGDIGGHHAPRTPTEELVCGIWAEVLGRDRVGRHDGFFEIGGHSLLATQVTSRVRRSLGVELPLRALFEAPTVAELAAVIDLARAQSDGLALPPLRPVPRTEALPLSFAQERLWFLDRLDPGSSVYNVPGVLAIEGALDVAALAASCREVVRRHEVLRTTFRPSPAGVEQVIAPAESIARLPLVDFGGLQDSAREAAAWAVAQSEASRAFDLERGPLLRAALLRVSDQKHFLLCSLHHIVSDGWSVGVFVRELAELYRAAVEGRRMALPELPVQYADYAVWQRSWLQGEVLAGQLEHWRTRLAGAPPVLELPWDRPRAASLGQRASVSRELALEPDLAGALRALGRREQATLFMTLLGGFAVLLHRLSAQDDLCIGTPVAGRGHLETEGLIGFFVNTLVIRSEAGGAATFRQQLERLRGVTLDAYQHQDLPFEKLVEELQPERSLAYAPLFQVMLVLQNTPQEALELPGLRLAMLPLGAAEAPFDLLLTLVEDGDDLAGSLSYNAQLCEAASAERLIRQWRTVLRAVAEQPEARWSDLPLLGAGERQQLLVEWNDTAAAPPASDAPSCLHELFGEQAARTPGAVALIWGEQRLTYGDLDRRSAALAGRLRALGVGPEVVVAVSAERTPALVVGLLGILRAGGAYVPLDPAYPRERRETILADSGAALLLASRRFVGEVAEWASGHAAILDLDDLADGGPAPAMPASDVGPANLAYLIYTSGSTGRPKGVAIEHGSAVALARWARRVFPAADWQGVLFSTSINFDLSVFELFVPLAWGGRVILADNALALPTLPAAGEVTLVNTVPSAMAELVRSGSLPAAVRTVILAGEPLARELADRIQALEGVERLFNLYGPSEDTTYSTGVLVPRAGIKPSIGRPIEGTTGYLLDRGQQPAPLGAFGELYLGGAGLARGYWRRPDLTAERFVPDPLGNGARLYRTGDLARSRPDGEIDFLGRIDRQVKVRGFRIELGEIEVALRAHAGVAEAVVLVDDLQDDRRLAAFVVAESPETTETTGVPTQEELRQHLRSRLPDHMIPPGFVFLEALPLTPNGKVDRRALAGLAPSRPAASPASERPRGPLGEALVDIWEEILHRPVGIRDDFFDLGGHSLLATRVMSRVQHLFGVDLPLRALFEHTTVESLAARLETALRERSGTALQRPALERQPHTEGAGLPLSFAQERFWFLDRLDPGNAVYNIPVAARLSGRLSVGALGASLDEIVRRHEVLRAAFDITPEGPVQRFAPYAPRPLSLVDLAALPPTPRSSEAARLEAAEAGRPFDLARGPLVRTVLVRTAAAEHLALLTFHHIAVDAWSMGLFAAELAALYAAFAAGRPSPLPEPALQYVDFALWQRRWLAGEALEHQLAFWKQALEGAPTVLALPADRPRPPVQRFRGRSQFSALPARLLGDLRRLGRSQGATPFMALLASLGALLGRLTAQDDLLVGTPIAGRPVPATEGLIGLFLNLLALRLDLRGGLAGGPGFGTLLRRVREVTFAAFAHQDLPFEKLIEELALARDLSHSPLFQIMLVLHNEPQGVLELPDLRLEFPETEGVGAKLDLVLNCEETQDGLGIRWIYNSDLFDSSRIARLAGHLENLLAAAVADPERPVGELPLLALHEVRQLLEWNDSVRAVPLDGGFLGHFGRQVARTPEAVAAACEGAELTYAEIDRRSDRLAGSLLGSLATTAGHDLAGEPVVAVLTERGLDWLTAMLALFKAGLVYLPLDPRHPAHRHAQVLRESRARLVLAAGELAPVAEEAIDSLPLGRQPVLLGFPDLAAPVSPSSPSALPRAELHQLAYVIFTSGSTGVPKGAMVAHLGMLNHLFAKIADLGLGATDTVAQTASQCFDISVWQLLAALLVGGRVEIFPDEVAQNPGLLLEQVRLRDVTILETVPSLLRAMVDEAAQSAARQEQALRWMMPTGEALPPDLCDRWLELFPQIPLINAYGPTECSDDVTHCVLREPLARGAVTVPIGRPVLNLQLYVGSRGLDLQPLGVPGELCVGGIAVGRGYLNDPLRTAAVFVPDPFSVEPGGRLYRTGDLARWLSSGELEFLGRVDHQVKVRGFRIELGEIETALASHPAVRETVVVARQQAAGEQRLIAYLALADEAPLEHAELAAFLRERIPEYMVPAAFVVLPALPLTANGKVDRKALPEPDEQAESRELVAPRNALEEHLAGHFRNLLKRERIGVHDDFFDLGGSSISGAVLVNRLQRELGEIIHVVVIFDAPTVERLAAYLVREHPEAVTRLWGGEVLAGRKAAAVPGSRVDAEKLAEMRRLIRPVAPAVVAARNPGAVFVLSPPRSGSTLLRVMLGGNPRLFAPPELELLPFDTLAEREAAFPARDAFWLEGAIRAVMEARGWSVDQARAFLDTCTREGWSTHQLYAEIQGWIGGRMLVDKTTTYALDVEVLRRAEQMFDEPRYLHLLRHPGAMIRSFEEAKLDQTFFRAPHRFARRELAELIWLVCEQNIGRFLGEVDPRRHHTVRFEDLVRDPVPVLCGICDFLEIDYHPAMAEPYQETRARMTDGLHEESRMLGDVKFHQHRGIEAGVAEQWREHLSEDELGDVTWSTAAALGYQRRVPPGRRAFSSLVRLRDGGEAPPLFLVHPVGGNVLCYAQLAQRLGAAESSGAIYGLQSAGLGMGALPHESIEAMAGHYIKALREVQPSGPYRFAGWSVGGVVAFEMARQLERAGESVELLALLDSVAPGVLPEGDPDPGELLFNLARDLAGLAGREEELEREIIERLDPEAGAAAVLRRAQEVGALPPDIDPAQAEQLWRVFRANATAARRYTPGPYAGRVSLVTSTRNPFLDIAGSHLGWDRWAGDLEVEVLAADHYDLLRQPAVLGLAAWLRARLPSPPPLSPDETREVHLLSPGA